ncbi:beta-ketoacyl synthase N-terminal-like domain-containing protein [Glutamicibacter endophyticus]|uniref:beta-ketoacyl synthase N-terminal-like domain-containing protein n=1 Tax=Glutamicibacter endophyticus TaxID=1522174 RepID=UPI003AF11819
MKEKQRTWISGVGVASPHGSTLSELWLGALRGNIVIDKVSAFDVTPYRSTLAGEVNDFRIEDVPGMLRPRTDRSTQLALVAAKNALDSTPFDYLQIDPYRRSIVTANSAGGYAFGEKELRNLYQKGPAYVSTAQSYAWFYAVNTGQLSIRYGFKGRCSTIVADSAGGLDAIWEGKRLLENGQELVLTGAVESFFSPLAWVSLESTGKMHSGSEPAESYLPFDERASGFVPAEGGAYLTLSSKRPAAKHGTAIHVSGHGKSMTVNEDGSRSIIRAIRLALEKANLEPQDIDVVFADGSGMIAEDAQEADAINEVFGAGNVPVTVPKAGFGRSGSGMGALDAVLAALTLKTKIIPPTPGVVSSSRNSLDIVTRRRRVSTARHALVISRGMPIFNSALIVSAA